LLAGVGGSHDKVELLVLDFSVPGAGSVDERLHLCGHGVEVHRRCHHDHIGSNHLLQDFRHVILLGTALGAFVAGAATRAVVDLPVSQEDLLGVVSGLVCTQHKLVAQQIGIPTLSWTGGQHQYFLAHLPAAHLLMLFRVPSPLHRDP
jgi:hypothetical protein